ncbi:MAG TPA: hypothetical protein VMJ14_00255 [Burkholderiales bacterium]|nr:hypothetical protein [Burkholderiales bacterium]
MKTNRRKQYVLGLLLTLATAFAADSALAGGYYHGGYHGYGGTHVVVGLGFGFPGYYGYGYGYPYYPYAYPYYPAYYPPVAVPQQPTTYVEQPQQQQPAPTGYWYFCPASQAYYPYVKECSAGWQHVAPQPAN